MTYRIGESKLSPQSFWKNPCGYDKIYTFFKLAPPKKFVFYMVPPTPFEAKFPIFPPDHIQFRTYLP